MWESSREYSSRGECRMWESAREHSRCVLCSFLAHHTPTQRTLMQASQKRAKRWFDFSTRWLKHRQAQIRGVLSTPGPNPCSPEPGTCDVPNLVAPGWSEPKGGSTHGQDQTTRINRNGEKRGSQWKII